MRYFFDDEGSGESQVQFTYRSCFSHMKSRKCWEIRLKHCPKLFFSPMEIIIFRCILTIGKILLCHEEQESHRMNKKNRPLMSDLKKKRTENKKTRTSSLKVNETENTESIMRQTGKHPRKREIQDKLCTRMYDVSTLSTSGNSQTRELMRVGQIIPLSHFPNCTSSTPLLTS